MRTWITRALAALASLAAIACLASPAGAQDVTVTPAAARVATGSDTLVPVRWLVTFRGSARIESPEGYFMDARGRTYGAAVREPLHGTGSGRVELRETLRVPASVVKAFRAAGTADEMRFRRLFMAPNTEAVGTLPLQPTNAILAVAARPARVGVEPQSATTMALRWEVSLLPGTTGPVGSTLSITSTEGVFRGPGGAILGRVATSISQPAPPPAPVALSVGTVAGTTALSEQLVVPHHVIDAALEAGAAWFTFQRAFAVGGDSAAGELRLDFGGRIAASFGIDRAELMFLDGTRFKTVPPGEEVQAAADVTFRGSGPLRGAWDLAGPTTTPGSAVFVRKAYVDELLSFGRRTLIRSPGIRAEEPGTYILRFSITAPANLGADALQVRFVVRAAGASAEVPLLQPPPLARLSPALAFSWGAVPGAQSFLLEFFDVPIAEGREPAAGMVLPGGQSRASLSPAAGRAFKPGRSYWWRVVALGPDGVLIGQSPMREMITPQE